MADVQITRRKQAGIRSAIRIDLTPMVDLAFLLITFFMLTTAMTRPQVMPVVMPDQEHPPDDPAFYRKASQVLTLLLGARDRVYYYEGLDLSADLAQTTYAADGLRQVVLNKKGRVDQQWPPSERPDPKRPGNTRLISRLTILIKPTEAASYKNVVDALDEMAICGIAHYVLMDQTEAERLALAATVRH